MKKMLVKAVALSLVMGGVGFVANNAQAFSPIEEIQLKSKVDANHARSMSNQDAINGIKTDVASNKANIQTNAKDIAANKAIATKAYGMAQTEQIERKIADVQIREDMKKADAANKELATRALSTANKALIDGKIADVQITEDMKKADKDLSDKIDAETDALKDADTKLNAKIDSNAAKVQEQLDAQDKKNNAQDVSIKANGEAINANKVAIDANADAIKANKAEADATNQYFNSRIENNTANIDNNKVAIENEATARKDAVNALNSRIDQVGSDATKGIAKASALAALHPLDYDPDNKFDIAAAGGFYKGENAFALGAFYRPNRNVMLSMGTTLTSGDNAYNVGLTFKIGKSGKHTEAGLTTADLYAMIGAMQDKMDQQQKKIEELEAKQAK